MDNKLKLRDYKIQLVDNLNSYEANSRVHSEDQINQVARSIEEFGFTNPLLIDENNTIIAGHCRLEAAKRLKMVEVPCIVINGLNEAQKAALVISDNKLALNASWNEDVLRSEFERLKSFDYDLELTGFGLEELCAILPQDDPEVFCGEDECPDIVGDPVTKRGDVWLLGEHRLMCGDSTIAMDVERLLNGQMPNTMVTDPPYGVKLDMSWRKKARGSVGDNTNLVKNDDRADWYDAYILFPGSIAYVWHASAFSDVVMQNLRDAGFEIKQQLIWRKTALVLGRSHYHWQHEPCWYSVKSGATANWKGDRKQTTVWDFDAPNQSNSKKSEDKTDHPTQKPVGLFEKSIIHHTNPGEYLYDPFAGSGTLVIACEKTKRRALTMELDPKYCDMILQRYEKYTGKKPILETQNA